ncbi:hypothetical protein PSACC_01259 [Paramicrosporidium saccamoebae]|uniref:Uncharacterized protein n=1 Tax=Paramicrosporidium saccamoebae TaxID=1246581 RepID=A0A2H9TMH6_9FUNG|nr:hypothetical protein PSACC_01259 [Paramicrosporidium saccamoebae]
MEQVISIDVVHVRPPLIVCHFNGIHLEIPTATNNLSPAVDALIVKEEMRHLPVHYKGTVTGLMEGGYIIDDGRRVLSSRHLQIGMEWTFYNLVCLFASEEVLVECPIFTGSLIPVSLSGRRQELRTLLKGIVSSSYFDDESKYQRLCRRLAGDDHVKHFLDHSTTGSCVFCTAPWEFHTVASCTAGPESRLTGLLLGKLEICAKTGRLYLRDSTGQIVIYSTQSMASFVDHLVLVSDSVLVAETVEDISLRYIIAKKITAVSLLTKDTTLLDRFDLLIIKDVGMPILLDSNKPMVVAIDAYHFGTLQTHRLEMRKQQSIELSMSASCPVQAGDIILRREDMFWVLFYEADVSLESKQAKISFHTPHLVSIVCSSVAADYLAQSQTLLRQDSLKVTVESKTFRKGSEIGLKSASNIRTPFFAAHAIGIPGSKHLCVTVRTATDKMQLVMKPNANYLYPMCLVPGAVIEISNVKSTVIGGGVDGSTIHSSKVRMLTPTTRTNIRLVGYDPDYQPSSSFPLRFLYELASDSALEDIAVMGKFFRFLSFRVTGHCIKCRNVIQSRRCIVHGVTPVNYTVEIVHLFTDNTWNCEMVIADHKLMVMDWDAIFDLSLDGPVEYVEGQSIGGHQTHKQLTSESQSNNPPANNPPTNNPLINTQQYNEMSRLPELLMPLKSNVLFIRDYTVKAKVTSSTRRLPRLQAIEIEPVDYVEQTRRLFAFLDSTDKSCPTMQYILMKPCILLSWLVSIPLCVSTAVDLKIRFGADQLHLQKTATATTVTVGVSGHRLPYALLWDDQHPTRVKVAVGRRRTVIQMDQPDDKLYRFLLTMRSQSLPFYRLLKLLIAPPSPPQLLLPLPLHNAIRSIPSAMQILVGTTLDSFETTQVRCLVPEVVDRNLTTEGSFQQKNGRHRDVIRAALLDGNVIVRVLMASDPALPILH